MIIASQIELRRGNTLLLDQATATIYPGHKVGLVGKNGCGKSTFFALIKGELSVDNGNLSLPAGWQMAWVAQETPALDKPALDYVIDGDREYRALEADLLAAETAGDGIRVAELHGKLEAIGGYSIRARAGSLLHGLGFSSEQHGFAVRDFSGGWRMRLNLAQALLCRSDLLLLDEPTNHLDLDAVIWLEGWLKAYRGTLLLISHDRDFLDRVIERIIHIENGKLNEYTGGYSDFELQRAELLAQQQSLYEKQQQTMAHMQSYIDRFRYKASKARQAQSRLKAMERMERILPAHVDSQFSFSFREPDALPTPLIAMENLSAGYGKRVILEKIKLNLVPGSRIGLLGRNGAGKSTFIKLLAGELAPLGGKLELARGVKIGYFAQHQLEYLRSDDSPLQHMTRLAPQHSEQELRSFLGGFGFHGDKALDPVGPFSGGEKARLVLALVVWEKPNLLLLDEPTNHLDLEMREALNMALQGFEGAMVIVSHDRHLLRSTADEFYLVHDRRVTAFDGDIDDYHRWLLDEERRAAQADKPQELASSPTQATARKDQKRREAEFRQAIRPLKQKIEKLEQRMEQLQQQLQDVESRLADPEIYTEAAKPELTRLLAQQGPLKTELEEVEMTWLELHESLQQQEQDFANGQ